MGHRHHLGVGLDDEHRRGIDEAHDRPSRHQVAAKRDQLFQSQRIDMHDDAELIAQSLRFEQRGNEFEPVGPRAGHHRDGSTMQRQWMYLDAARAVLCRKPHDEFEAVDVVQCQCEDQPERDTRRANDLEIRHCAGERSVMATDCIVFRRCAVDGNRDDIEQGRQCPPTRRRGEHAVGGDSGEHAQSARVGEQLGKLLVEQGLAARHRELAIAQPGSVVETGGQRVERKRLRHVGR